MRIRTKIILFLILGLAIGIFLSFKGNSGYSNEPCYLDVKKGELELQGINKSEIDFYLNEENGNFVILNKTSKEEILECI